MRRAKAKEDAYRIFFATDIHGSDVCFRKFVNAASVFGVDAVIMGGDITGKYFVLVVQDGSRWRVNDRGAWRELDSRVEVESFNKRVNAAGGYPLLVSTDEEDQLASDPAFRSDYFRKAILSRVEGWVDLAEERLAPAGIRCLISPGNDDHPEVGEVLSQGSWVENPEGRIVELGGHEVVSWGWSTPTPWNTPREQSEEELASAIERATADLTEPSTAIFNLHCPPVRSGLDEAPALDQDLRPIVRGGQVEIRPVGSSAVREAIERQQPLLALHGHIHESRAIKRIGRSVCVNPGSDYHSGTLRGTLVQLKKDKVRGCTLTTG